MLWNPCAPCYWASVPGAPAGAGGAQPGQLSHAGYTELLGHRDHAVLASPWTVWVGAEFT